MRPEITARLKRTALFCLIALAAGAAIGFLQVRSETRSGTAVSQLAGADIGGAYTLVNQDGQDVSEQSYAGQYKLIYFGFTYCPAICPTELQKISQTLKILEAQNSELAKSIQPLFITIDPERDTPDVMRAYVEMFHPRLIGLTGSLEQIDAVKKSYRIYAAKVTPDGASEYTMDHSSFIYFMAPDDTLLGIYRAEDSAEKMAEEITLLTQP